MNDQSRTGIEIVQVAALVAILGDSLLRGVPWGIGFSLFVVAIVVGFLMLTRRHRPEFFNKSTIALAVAALFFGLAYTWRDAEELVVYDFLALLAVFSVLIVQALGVRLDQGGAAHYVAGFFWSGINVAFSPFLLFLSDIEWKSASTTGWRSTAFATIRGILLVAPLLLIFGALFMAADAVFEGVVQRAITFDIGIVISHVILTSFLFWIVAGYLRGNLVGFVVNVAPRTSEMTSALPPATSIVSGENASADEVVGETKSESAPPRATFAAFDNSVLPRMFTLGIIETSIILGLVNLLFLVFVIIQVPYLFGGFELVQSTPNFKLADYARRGFGELVAVAALVLPILLTGHWLLRRDNPLNEKVFRVLAGIQIGLLFVIMASAAQRLFILTGNLGYGMTTIRFYPFVVMMWLAVVFVWFGWTVLRGNRHQFAWGALWAALLLLAGLHFVNPDDFIVKTNLRLASEGRQFDAYYNVSLSDDAVPALVAGLNGLSESDRLPVVELLSHRLCTLRREHDFRTLNWSRKRAAATLEANELVRNHSAARQCMAGPEPTGRFEIPDQQ